MTVSKKTHHRMVIALSLALDEIHHPGAARSAGVDITALLESVIKEATPNAAFDIAAAVREEMNSRAGAA